jgi:Ca2+/Na+ antiporter
MLFQTSHHNIFLCFILYGCFSSSLIIPAVVAIEEPSKVASACMVKTATDLNTSPMRQHNGFDSYLIISLRLVDALLVSS